MAYIPPTVTKVLSERYTVRPGDTLEGIARFFGQHPADYRMIVGANLERPLVTSRSAPGLAAKVSLSVGDEIKIPAIWGFCLPCQQSNPAALGAFEKLLQALDPAAAKILQSAAQDNQLDPSSLRVSELTGAYLQAANLSEDWRQGIYNAAVQWWRQDHLVKPPENLKELRPYLDSARDWMAAKGQHLSPSARASIPWARIPWDTASRLFPVIALGADWGAVKNWIEANVSVGQLQSDPAPTPLAKTSFLLGDVWTDGLPAAWPWHQIGWAVIPWHLIPWSKIDTSRLAKPAANEGPASFQKRATAAWIAEVARVLGVPVAPQESAPAPKPPPGGRPPRGPLQVANVKLPVLDKEPATTAEKPIFDASLSTGAKIAIGFAVFASVVTAVAAIAPRKLTP